MTHRDPSSRPPARRATRRRVWWVVLAVLVLGRIAVVPITLGQAAAHGKHKVLTGDIRRFYAIANSTGTPYRDFEVEYPPLMYGAIKVLDSSTVNTATRNTMWTQLVLDLAVAALLAWGWGKRAGMAYLILGVPFLFYPFLYLRLDLLSVALAVGGLALVRHRRPVAGGVTLALACFAKVWPVLLIPGLVVRRAWRALAACLAVGAAGVAAWIAWAGTNGLVQVLSMRGATGWEIESTVGGLVHSLTDDRVHLQRGAWRIGSVPGWAFVGLGAVCAVLVVTVWVLAALRRPHGAMVLDGVAALGAVSAFLICSPLLSPQFVIWIVPFAAIVAARGDRVIAGLVLAIVALSVLDLNLVWELVHTNLAIPQGAVLLRNLLLVGLVGVCVQRLWQGARRPAQFGVADQELVAEAAA